MDVNKNPQTAPGPTPQEDAGSPPSTTPTNDPSKPGSQVRKDLDTPIKVGGG